MIAMFFNTLRDVGLPFIMKILCALEKYFADVGFTVLNLVY